MSISNINKYYEVVVHEDIGNCGIGYYNYYSVVAGVPTRKDPCHLPFVFSVFTKYHSLLPKMHKGVSWRNRLKPRSASRCGYLLTMIFLDTMWQTLLLEYQVHTPVSAHLANKFPLAQQSPILGMTVSSGVSSNALGRLSVPEDGLHVHEIPFLRSCFSWVFNFRVDTCRGEFRADLSLSPCHVRMGDSEKGNVCLCLKRLQNHFFPIHLSAPWLM